MIAVTATVDPPPVRTRDELLPISIPSRPDRAWLVVPDVDRDRGIRFGAGSGSGKSVVMGKAIALQDFLRGVPQVLFDPHGPLIDNFLHQVAHLPRPLRQRLWPRIVYIDMAGSTADRIVPFPLHFALGGESRRDVADRFLTTLRKLDPHLQSASVQGWNALYRIGAPTGIILSALDLQLDEAEDLLRAPELWESRLTEAMGRHPEAAAAVAYFRDEYMMLKPGDRLRLAGSYLGKLAPFTFDPNMRAMFTTSPPGLDLRSAVEGGKTVLLDFRHETNPERRRFKTRWVFEYLMAFVKHRGAGRHLPLGIMIDELTELTNQASLEHDLFATDLDELINVYGRNYALWLTLAHQELFQVSEKTRKTLLTMGTQILGVTADMEAARELGYQFGSLDPYRVKRWENVWGHGPVAGDYVIEQRPVDLPLEEQNLLAAQAMASLRPFQFLVQRRGAACLERIDARSLTTGPWASDYPILLGYIRYQLAQRQGVQWCGDSLPTATSQPLADVTMGYEDDDDIYWETEQ